MREIVRLREFLNSVNLAPFVETALGTTVIRASVLFRIKGSIDWQPEPTQLLPPR